MNIYIANLVYFCPYWHSKILNILNDSVDDVDDSIGSKDVDCNNCTRGSRGSNSDPVMIPGHGNLFTTRSCQGCITLGNICRLKEKRNFFQIKTC